MASTLSAEQMTDIKKIESPLHAKLNAAGVSDVTMAHLGKVGVTSIAMLTAVADDRKDLRKFLLESCAMDPSSGTNMVVEIGRIVVVYDQCNTKVAVEAKVEAERSAAQLPPQVHMDEYHAAVKLFKDTHFKATEAQIPSKAYFEAKFGQLTGQFEPERLTEITSRAQADHNSKQAGKKDRLFEVDEANCGFRLSTKAFIVAMPSDSEVLRARIRLMGICYSMLLLKSPSYVVLQTQTSQLWSDYTDFLFGDDVWGFVAEDELGNPIAGPHIGHVIGYDFKIRKEVADHMNEGIDIKTAFGKAMNCPALRLKSFLMPVSAAINDGECKALTAPALQEARFNLPGRTGAGKRKLGDGDTRSAAAKKKARRQDRHRALADANPNGKVKKDKGVGKGGRQLALQNGNVAPPPQAHRAQRPPKGEGKARWKTADGKQICFAFNNGQICKIVPCSFAHVYQLCDGEYAKSQCPNR